jgi:acetate kinase
MSNRILVANIGSTSFKFQLLEMPEEKVVATGRVERIGSADCPWMINVNGSKTEGTSAFSNWEAAIEFTASAVESGGAGSFRDVAAFGFKPVMAKEISGTQFLDTPVLEAMEALTTLLPVHNPAYVNGVRVFNKLYPGIPCVGTFETAFYDQMPETNTWFPVPFEWREKYGIKRTGFHGASHRYVTQRAA